MASGFDEVVLDGKAGQVSVVAQVQFFQQTESIGINRFDADVIGRGDLSVGVAQGKASKYLQFPGGEGVQWALGPVAY